MKRGFQEALTTGSPRRAAKPPARPLPPIPRTQGESSGLHTAAGKQIAVSGRPSSRDKRLKQSNLHPFLCLEIPEATVSPQQVTFAPLCSLQLLLFLQHNSTHCFMPKAGTRKHAQAAVSGKEKQLAINSSKAT